MAAPTLAAIWRYPVKSLQGEQLATAEIDATGIRGDRWWGIRHEASGQILTGRREPRLLLAAAHIDPDGEPVLTLPGGAICPGVGADTDAALSEWLQDPVSLVDARIGPGARAEFFADATDDSSQAIQWTMPAGRFVDAAHLLVLTTASLATGASLYPAGDWDARRFRPNLLIDHAGEGWAEDAWAGQTVCIGTVEVVPTDKCIRCTMVTRVQPGLERDLDIYRTVSRHHEGRLGMWTEVRTPGPVTAGAAVVVEDRST